MLRALSIRAAADRLGIGGYDMRKVRVFDNVSLDGFFTDAKNDMSWAHKQDAEWNAFTAGNASGGEGALLFGRVTYQQMESFWPTPQAAQMMPEVAKGMNAMPKYVVSRTLQRVDWRNTTLLKGDLVAEIRVLKAQDGPDLVILGSGRVVSQLSAARLVDEYQLVVHPLVLGTGRTLFETLTAPLPLRRTNARTFANGCVVGWYEPA
jgi:dihydrofolate reductase